MAVPDFETLMLPVLRILADGNIHTLRSLRDGVARMLSLSDDEINEKLPSGLQSRLMNRIGWAKMDMVRAGLIDTPARGQFKLSQEGRKVLSSNPQRIDVEYLMRFSSFIEWRQSYRGKERTANETAETRQKGLTPEEQLAAGYQELRAVLASDILQAAKLCPPQFFEQLVMDLLLKMGYGGSLKDAGEVIGKSGDGGIDGVIKEDKLGLDIVYIQAKRLAETTVGRPAVQAFAGSLLGHRAKKGVFITTSQFSNEAREYAKTTGDQKIVLIDGNELAQLMIDYNIGVSTVATYEVKKIDYDYYPEDATIHITMT